MVESDDVFTAIAAFALDAHQFFRIDVIAVVRGIGTGVAATGGSHHDATAVVLEAPQQHAAAFVRISFFAMAAHGFVVSAIELQHVEKFHHRNTEAPRNTDPYLNLIRQRSRNGAARRTRSFCRSLYGSGVSFILRSRIAHSGTCRRSRKGSSLSLLPDLVLASDRERLSTSRQPPQQQKSPPAIPHCGIAVAPSHKRLP